MDESECMYFMINEEKVFDKCMEIWEKSCQYNKKKFNSELIYCNSKTFNIKESFQCFYINVILAPIILIDSVYRKNENLLS